MQISKKKEFTDDTIFQKVMENESICSRMLEILLEIKIDHVKNFTADFMKERGFNSGGVRLEVHVKDSDDFFYVVMQINLNDDPGLRSRYFQSEMDVYLLNHRKIGEDLKDSYVIFLCTEDPFDEDMPVYIFTRRCREGPSIKQGDGTRKYFFIASSADKITDNEEEKNLLTYISTHVPQNAFTQEIEDAVILGNL